MKGPVGKYQCPFVKAGKFVCYKHKETTDALHVKIYMGGINVFSSHLDVLWIRNPAEMRILNRDRARSANDRCSLRSCRIASEFS